MLSLKRNRMIARTALVGALGLATAALAVAEQPASAPVVVSTKNAAPPAAIAAPQKQPAKPRGELESGMAMGRQLLQARSAKNRGEWAAAQAGMLDAARQYKLAGMENDQIKILREMTLEPVIGKPEPAQQYAKAGQRAMAEVYYSKYLNTKPRDAQWLLEALGWANYAGDEAMLKRFIARVPDKAHENIDERGRQRGMELHADDTLYQAFNEIRLAKNTDIVATLKVWQYPINVRHSQMGTSLLHTATWYNKTDIVKILVEQYQADVNVADNDGDTPLDYAYHLKLDELAAYLKSKGGKPNNNYHLRKSEPATEQKKKP